MRTRQPAACTSGGGQSSTTMPATSR
uniref:Uncharacterized protein n=1 Tax=Macrostomum lignano TaxID=282301 RepID=A0A1I8J7G9_9PLAT